MSQKGDLPAAALSPLGATLCDAVGDLREQLNDQFAPITIIVPAGPNGVLARRALTAHGPILRVWFETPEGLLREQTPISFFKDLKPEPAGWMRVTVARIVDEANKASELGRFGEVLSRPGFRNPLVAALSRLSADGISSDDLLAVQGDESIVERAKLLANLLIRLENARKADGVASPKAHTDAATAAINREGVGPALAKGAIVIGDRDLPHLLSGFVAAWLGSRRTVRVTTPGLSTMLDTLALAAGNVPAPEVKTDLVPRELASVLQRVFAHTYDNPPVRDGSVVIARTPDDVRECVECVREVKRAIADGVALDRIAIVLPDGNQRAALEEALDRANIPPTWLTGFPARELQTAKLLSVAMEIVCDDETPLRLFELLSHPAFFLRGALGPNAVKGRGRWRRMLAKISGARGLDRIVRGIEKLADEDTHGANGDPQGVEREQDARKSLVAAVKAIQEAITPLRDDQQLAGHVRRWRAFLEKFTRKSESRARLLALLEPISLTLAGPPLTAVQAREELAAILDREIARGALTERSIRVLPPMHMLGGEFDVVCILGLTEKRFPTQAKEDALLSDELLNALSQVVKRQLPTSKAIEDFERRRFAAAVGAARKKLWLSVPSFDFERERPTLASSFALEVLSILLGKRARFSDLSTSSIRAGSRARTYPTDERDSISAGEHLLARVAKSPDTALPAIAVRSTSSGLLALFRSMHRLRKQGVIDQWTGLVPRELLSAPGLDGTPVALSIIEAVLSSPADLFFRSMLGAFPPRRLRPRPAPLERPALEELLAEIAGEETIATGDIASLLAASVVSQLNKGVELGTFSSAELDGSKALVNSIASVLSTTEERYFRARDDTTQGRAVSDGTPWKLAEIIGRVIQIDDARVTLIDVRSKIKTQSKLARDLPALGLSALALNTAGAPLESIGVITPSGKTGEEPTTNFIAMLKENLDASTKKIEAGQFYMNGHPKLGLTLDGVEPVDPEQAGDDE